MSEIQTRKRDRWALRAYQIKSRKAYRSIPAEIRKLIIQWIWEVERTTGKFVSVVVTREDVQTTLGGLHDRGPVTLSAHPEFDETNPWERCYSMESHYGVYKSLRHYVYTTIYSDFPIVVNEGEKLNLAVRISECLLISIKFKNLRSGIEMVTDPNILESLRTLISEDYQLELGRGFTTGRNINKYCHGRPFAEPDERYFAKNVGLVIHPEMVRFGMLGPIWGQKYLSS